MAAEIKVDATLRYEDDEGTELSLQNSGMSADVTTKLASNTQVVRIIGAGNGAALSGEVTATLGVLDYQGV